MAEIYGPPPVDPRDEQIRVLREVLGVARSALRVAATPLPEDRQKVIDAIRTIDETVRRHRA
jgi:hypothetical protein